MNKISMGFLGLGLLAALAGCAEREIILEGERFGTRTPLDQAFPGLEAPAVAEDVSLPITLAAPTNLDAWPMRALTTRNVVPHLALSGAPVEIWASDIGQGNTRRARITADPVAADGRIFTLDSDAQLTAIGTDGTALWTADLTAGYERGGGVSGGGLAVVGGVVHAPRTGVLPGVTLGLVLELCAELGMPVVDRPPPADPGAIDELAITSSGRGIWPATRLDGRPVGPGRPGPVVARLAAAWDDHLPGWLEHP